MLKLIKILPEQSIFERMEYHDVSKFSEEEFIPYVVLSWSKHKNIELGGLEQHRINQAINHHYAKNKHHPEFFSNISYMEDLNLLEMFADWAAMSIEFNNSLLDFMQKNIGTRWKFTRSQIAFLQKLYNLEIVK